MKSAKKMKSKRPVRTPAQRAARRTGRPRGAPIGANTSYKPEYVDVARAACEAGATDSDLAEMFRVTTRTIANWRIQYPTFLTALKDGKDISDAQVEKSLYHRAMGYSSPAVKFHLIGRDVVLTHYTEYIPPDVTACIFWLKNRQQTKWRDRRETEHDGNVTVTIRRVRAKIEGDDDV